jgi:hypothetical protein
MLSRLLRQPLTFFADMISVAFAGKFLIGSLTITNPAIVTHGKIIVCYSSFRKQGEAPNAALQRPEDN